MMHRVILKAKKGQYVDHGDDNGLNNQRNNIRICTNSQNLQKARKKKGKASSKYKGVHFVEMTKKWKATITTNYKFYYLGCFKTEKEAAIAYNKAAKKYYKDFARLNIIE